MEAIKARVRNGRVETDTPLDLADGTQVLIVPPTASSDEDDEWDNSPEGIAAWLKWYDSVEPLIFTEQEREALEKDRQDRRTWELAHFDERTEKLIKLWE